MSTDNSTERPEAPGRGCGGADSRTLVVTGIADEAHEDIEGQLDMHEELGWRSIELRSVDGVNVTRMSDKAFDGVAAAIAERGFSVVGLGSAIANWGRPITMDFSEDVGDLRRAVPRMRRLGTQFIRIMSYPNDDLSKHEWRAEVFRRLRELTRIAEGEGVVLLHENCDGWGSESPENLSALTGEMDSPAFRIVFDPGNPVAHGQSVEEMWAFYHAARAHIDHFHIKDVRREADGTVVHTYPGDGWCELQTMMAELLASAYIGAFSIEPHMANQAHRLETAASSPDSAAIYREYGRRANELIAEVTGRA